MALGEETVRLCLVSSIELSKIPIRNVVFEQIKVWLKGNMSSLCVSELWTSTDGNSKGRGLKNTCKHYDNTEQCIKSYWNSYFGSKDSISTAVFAF